MILTRTPLRVTLGGGGTDLDSYAGEGFCLAAAIDKYVYIALVETFDGRLLVNYSKSEHVEHRDQIEHPLVRQALWQFDVDAGLHISSMADVPAGTGLGSSASFSVGLAHALAEHRRRPVSTRHLAAIGCLIDPVGMQDQFIAAYGGIQALSFGKQIRVAPVDVPDELEDNLVLFFTGYRRAAADELNDQAPASDETRDIGWASRDALVDGDLGRFSKLLSEQWRLKYLRSPSRVHDEIDGWLRVGLEAGAYGGKLVGAGGGGFLMFYAEHKSTLREAMGALGLREVRFGFDHRGSVVL